MKVIVERSGGFAGVKRRGEKDGASLTPAQHEALQQLMRATPASPPTGADRFHYQVEVQDETGSRTVDVPETAMPPSLASIATE
jgi:hypothetical protein